VKISKKLEKLVDLKVEEQFPKKNPMVWVGKRQNLLGEKKNTEL
jgi:hypothetical protein